MALRKDRFREFFLLMFALAGLFVPSVYVRAIMICVIGYLIYWHERRLGFLVPTSPGFVFWLGNFGSYVFGGIGTGMFYGIWDGYGMIYLRDAMFYIGLGLAFFLIGAWLAKSALYPLNRTKNITLDLVLNQRSILLLGGIYLFSVVGKQKFSLGSGELTTFYDNIVFGLVQSAEMIPLILLGIYMTRQDRNLFGVLILIVAGLSVSFSGILIGYGRSKLLSVLIFGTMVWFSLKDRKKHWLSMKSTIVIIVGIIFFVFLFGLQTHYRGYNSDDFTRMTMSKQEMINAAFHNIHKSDNLITDTLGQMCLRANELNSLELFGRAKDGIIARSGWTMNDLKQVLLSWIPKMYFPAKGDMTGREIMVFYGFGEGNIPPSLLGDVFRRSGVVGLIVVYFSFGVLSTLIAAKLRKSWGDFGIVLSFYFALLMSDMYVRDAINCYTIFIYRLPSTAIMIYAILRLSGILSGQSKKKPYFRQSKFQTIK